METLQFADTAKRLDVRNACLDDSTLDNVSLQRWRVNNVTLAGTKITDANLSDLEIDGAQLGGAYIHNIGLPPEGHPNHVPNAVQRPLRFENCYLAGSRIEDCNLSGVSISMCNLSGMTIDGILVEDLLKEYEKARTKG